MSSTISGLASVVTSPTSAKLEIPAITRRMIFPERVLGMSETIQTRLGRAIFPISVSIALATFCSMSLLGVYPDKDNEQKVAKAIETEIGKIARQKRVWIV